MKFFNLILVFVAFMVFASCNKEQTNNDVEIYNEYKEGGLNKYQNGDLLEGKSPSPHGEFKLYYNATAATVLNSEGELPTGQTFPDGSLLIKEIFKDGKVDLIAAMKKSSTDEQSGSNWLWGEYKPNGDVVVSTSSKGSSCVGCHSGTPNRDLTRTYDLH